MNELNVCFVGIGSIAKRHINNLKKICIKRNIRLIIDALRRSACDHEERKEYGLHTVFTDYRELNRVYDIIFITNPTEYHLDTLQKLSPFGNRFFIEKPLCSVTQLDQVKELELKSNSIYYVACPLRYNAVIQYIKNNINSEDIICARSISSSFLPDWRPGTDYRKSYSAHKSLGGGVSIDLIHEWDYLTYLLGSPRKVNYMSGKKSDLEIDSDDYAVYIAEYDNKIVELHLDYFGRKTIREIMLFTREETILGDIANNKMVFMRSGKQIDFRELRDDYQIRELENFLDMLEGDVQDNNIMHALNVLRLTQGVIG